MLNYLIRRSRNHTFSNNGHWQTILPYYLTRRSLLKLSYQRQRLITDDGDFIDLDWVNPEVIDQPTVILFHGMEGNSQSHYAKRIMYYLQSLGWRGVVAHFRGCSGEMNSRLRFYHAGETHDLRFVINTIHNITPGPLFTAGVSLGGNALLKYLGEENSQSNYIDAAIAISVPFNLEMTSLTLDKGLNKRLYVPYFLASLLPKMKHYSQQFPEFKLKAEIKNLDDFNEQYITQMFNFRDALDYYQQASSIFYLKNIKTPTLLLQAANDPMIPVECWPKAEQLSSSTRFIRLKAGGHAGFVGNGHNLKQALLKLPQIMIQYYRKHL